MRNVRLHSFFVALTSFSLSVTGQLPGPQSLAPSGFATAPTVAPNVEALTRLPVYVPPATSTPNGPPAPLAPSTPVFRPFPAGRVRPPSYPPINQAPVAPVGPEVLQWDSLNKEYIAKPGELTAQFTFAVTNVSKSDVVINWVHPSCGCTVAKLPPTPWKLAPGEGGNVDFTVDLRGKFGVLSKYVSVDTSAGPKLLTLKITVPSNGNTLGGMDNRSQNIQMAMADRQAVFKNDCARCHVAPTVGKKGQELFAAACGICHEAPHRATMVPDLRQPKVHPDKTYWLNWASNGKPGSLMPAFAQENGGPLTREQIESLADYLTNYYPPRTIVSAPTPTTDD